MLRLLGEKRDLTLKELKDITPYIGRSQKSVYGTDPEGDDSWGESIMLDKWEFIDIGALFHNVGFHTLERIMEYSTNSLLGWKLGGKCS